MQERVTKSQATRLVALAADVELFHTGEIAYTRVPVGTHHEVLGLRAAAFKRWLGRQSYQASGAAPTAAALQDALGVLESQALYDGPDRPIFTRVAEHDGDLYLDLGDPDWRAVRITSERWEVIADSPVMFRRARGLRPLPVPVQGKESLDDLRRFINVGLEDQHAWVLLLA
ncbi:MAG: hypothetical protein ACR2JC_05980 [Chloroflexota bacterium]|nr:MAG: hypothetical protein DLM70_05155 [Chloroflexota bacterium]